MSHMNIARAPLPDAPPLPTTPPLPDVPSTPPLPQVTAGRGGLPPFMSRLKQRRQKTPKAPLAPIASRAAARGERQREHVETAKAVQQATQKPSNVTPIRPEVTPEPAPKPPSKAQQMRDALAETFGKRVSDRMQGTPAGAHELLRQYGRIHGRHFVGEYHAAGMARARELVEQARAAHQRGTPANPAVKQAAREARAAQEGQTVPDSALNQQAMKEHVALIRDVEAQRQASGQKIIRTDLEGGEK